MFVPIFAVFVGFVELVCDLVVVLEVVSLDADLVVFPVVVVEGGDGVDVVAFVFCLVDGAGSRRHINLPWLRIPTMAPRTGTTITPENQHLILLRTLLLQRKHYILYRLLCVNRQHPLEYMLPRVLDLIRGSTGTDHHFHVDKCKEIAQGD